ncbi:MAG TPA: hypothetical protein VGA07_14160 [Anaerolineales bacterium]
MRIIRFQPSFWASSFLALCVASLALAPSFAQDQSVASFGQVPVVALDPVDGGFFVLASHLPFRVSKAQPEAAWFDVEAAAGSRTEPRMVSLSVSSRGLAPGTYYSAVLIEIDTPQRTSTIQIPVAMEIPGSSRLQGAFSALEAGVPPGLAQLQVDVPTVAVRFKLTPARHYIVEVVDLVQERQQNDRMAASAADLLQSQGVTGPSQTYELVFPWLCLEVCGRNVTNDTADVAPNLDAVNALSYERYRMVGGTWGLLNVGDPGPWASDNGLLKWPMLIGGYKPAASSILAMWNNRATILAKLIEEADTNDYLGYNVDVEGHASSGKDTFIKLMDYLADGLHAEGYKLMVVHATWATLAPIEDLAATSVDYVATMDPYTGSWAYNYIPDDYAAIDPQRLVWGFTWDKISDSTQTTMWDWMETNGYNAGVAGAAVWRTPLMPPHQDNNLDYYEGLRRYYPKGGTQTATLWQSLWRGNEGWYRTVPIQGTQVDWNHASTWAGPISLSGMPGSGTIRTLDDFVVGSVYWQSFWRTYHGWYRTVPVVNGAPDWRNAGLWQGPSAVAGLPGGGTLQTQGGFVAGTTLWQSIWRGDQGWYRTVPIVDGQIQWRSAGGWQGPTTLAGLPGSGSLQAQSDYVLDDQILYQTIWRDNKGYTRSVPIVGGAVQWGKASVWGDPVDAASMPGTGSIQTFSETEVR